MSEVKFCVKCTMSNQRPRITFDERGVRYGVQLIMYGENGEVEYGGDMKNAQRPDRFQDIVDKWRPDHIWEKHDFWRLRHPIWQA